MKTFPRFGKQFTLSTKVQLPREYGYRSITDIHENRNWIKVEGIEGSVQRADIITFTNKTDVDMFPALDDLYLADQYDSVYERGDDSNIFVGKLKGRTLKQFVADMN